MFHKFLTHFTNALDQLGCNMIIMKNEQNLNNTFQFIKTPVELIRLFPNYDDVPHHSYKNTSFQLSR